MDLSRRSSCVVLDTMVVGPSFQLFCHPCLVLQRIVYLILNFTNVNNFFSEIISVTHNYFHLQKSKRSLCLFLLLEGCIFLLSTLTKTCPGPSLNFNESFKTISLVFSKMLQDKQRHATAF